MRDPLEIKQDIDSLPLGDIEGDHVLLDRYTIETLKLCLETPLNDDAWFGGDLHALVDTLIQKWDALREEFWYA